ncbi:hypothetical protein [Sphingomonas sp. BK580]|uniref:hypothetical protein n=1 Tax=Sphingomonas sp. BK580 TaxID=2586972 RepID=UPI00160E2473|nr:hypothetical protein [Sphingomonas sp. BK580]MBB3693554.1 hypothetical protein [Sphingomonas sp. BK580]
MKIKTSAARQRAELADRLAAPSSAFDVRHDGEELTMLIPDPATGRERSIFISRFAVAVNLMMPLARGLHLYAGSRNVASIRSVIALSKQLGSGLILFLEETDRREISLAGIDRTFLLAFRNWLNATTNGAARFKPNTRAAYFKAVAQVLEHLRTDSMLGESVIDANEMPSHGVQKRERSIKEADADLLEHELRSIVKSAGRAVRGISERVRADLNLDHSTSHVSQLALQRRAAVAEVRVHLLQGRGSWTTIQGVDPGLAQRILDLGREEIMRSARPEPEELVPFIVLFTIAFRLNGGVLMSARRSGFEVRSWIGGERAFLTAYKPRARRRVTASVAVSDDPTNPAEMMKLLDEWAKPLRRLTGSLTLFQFWSPNIPHGPAISVDTVARPDVEATLNSALRRFLARTADHVDGVIDASDITFSRIRKAVLDLAHVVSRGDLLMVKAAANHTSAQTTSDHYVTAAGMAREDEALARAMNSHARMIATRGSFDPRRLTDEPTEACTPGWNCTRGAKPSFDGSRGDQQCLAYGRCPVCRHGSIDFSSPRACAQAHLLVDAIERAIESMPPASWHAQLAPIRNHLLRVVLKEFASGVHKQARALELPALPSPE